MKRPNLAFLTLIGDRLDSIAMRSASWDFARCDINRYSALLIASYGLDPRQQIGAFGIRDDAVKFCVRRLMCELW